MFVGVLFDMRKYNYVYMGKQELGKIYLVIMSITENSCIDLQLKLT